MPIPFSRKITTDLLQVAEPDNKSVAVVSRLQDSIISRDLPLFEKIYSTEYLYDPEVFDEFRFEDENNNNWFNTYSLCTCENKKDEPMRIHRHMNVRKCNCINGKRYLAYLMAYNIGVGSICYDTNCKNVKQNEDAPLDIRWYLIKNGPIDLTYEQFYYSKP